MSRKVSGMLHESQNMSPFLQVLLLRETDACMLQPFPSHPPTLSLRLLIKPVKKIGDRITRSNSFHHITCSSYH